jgi:hypothetical protein
MNKVDNVLIQHITEIIGIVYSVLIYFVVGYIFSFYVDLFFLRLYGTDYKSKSLYILLFEVVTQIITILIAAYMCRNICKYIRFPLNGYYDYDNGLLKELLCGASLNLFLMLFQYSMQNKLEYIKNQIVNKHNNS